jgi:hypothetical protein
MKRDNLVDKAQKFFYKVEDDLKEDLNRFLGNETFKKFNYDNPNTTYENPRRSRLANQNQTDTEIPNTVDNSDAPLNNAPINFKTNTSPSLSINETNNENKVDYPKFVEENK